MGKSILKAIWYCILICVAIPLIWVISAVGMAAWPIVIVLIVFLLPGIIIGIIIGSKAKSKKDEE